MPTATDRLRSRVAGLSRLAANDLAIVWRRSGDLKQQLHDVLPTLTAVYGRAAAAVAADWYDEQRLRAGVAGTFAAVVPEVSDEGAHALAGWATDTASDSYTLRVLVEGGLQRRIANAARSTVMGSAVADPGARGWQRTGSGECAFCAMLIGRGAVYSEASADFASHDHCNCSAMPAWGGQPVPVKPYTVSPRRKLDENGKPVIDADFLRAKKWIADHQ